MLLHRLPFFGRKLRRLSEYWRILFVDFSDVVQKSRATYAVDVSSSFTPTEDRRYLGALSFDF